VLKEKGIKQVGHKTRARFR